VSGDGYAFDPEAAQQVEKGLNDAIAELDELGFDIQAQMGRGFDDLQLSHMEAGHPGLESTFANFCERWGWGVRNGVQDANTLAAGLGLSAGIYHEQEQYVVDTMKIAGNAAMGDPTKSEQEVTDGSWGEALNPYHDMGAQPLDMGELGKPWERTGQDLSTSPFSPFVGQDTDWQWGGAPEEKTEGHREEGDG